MSDNGVCPGRIIYGLHCPDHAGLNRPLAQTWNSETEERYMEQVRERAQQMAKDILTQALAEAQQIRLSAQAEGFAAGQRDAASIAEQEGAKVRSFLDTLHAALLDEKKRIYSEHKQTLFTILRLAFEKTLGVMLDKEREQVLNTLFEEAVAQLQAKTCITVHVCKADLELASTLAEQFKQKRADLPEIRVCASPALEPGGVRIESGDGLVDNSIAARFEQVKDILDGYVENS